MSVCEGVFSLRVVIADFYMEKPILGLDPVYSEFRGKEIKKVPIIRVFGSNGPGQKTCMHIHGVFPYLYVPYDQKDFDSVNKALHQMAMSLDKAINISLSQGSSAAQHVFKVQLVKGIPFYGYHRSEHQYLKIYMFNPRFVRRAANLLQNGAIMNKNFHPHEAHVPYVLQFMIDHNLYGMSFLHVPLEIVKFRRSDATEQIPFKNLGDSQILDHIVAKKMSCSALEIDIGSNFILNRFQLIAKTNATHTNPGIESIWNDERLRRQKMTQMLEDYEEKLKAIPPLEVPSTQERSGIYPTDSETFYRTALISKLAALETTQTENSQASDQTIGSTFQTNVTLDQSSSAMTNRNHKMTFNLKKILQNSVYPEECTQNDDLINASFVENHLSSKSVFEQSLQMDLSMDLSSEKEKKMLEDESVFLDDTLVDEEYVLSLTPAEHQVHVPLDATLRDEDLELLGILQELEMENNESKIDLDSSLAPLSQKIENYDLPADILQKKTTISEKQENPSNADCDEEDIDEENLHDFSIALESVDDLILKFTQSQNDSIEHHPSIPNKIDGSDDLLKTPTKASKFRENKTPPRTPTIKPRRISQASPSRSPRTPKSGHKSRPLPLIITNRSTEKKALNDPAAEATATKTPVTGRVNDLPSDILRKRIAINEFRRKSISIETDERHRPTDLPIKTNLNRRRSKRLNELDKTHITCNLTPRKTNEKCLKVYTIDEHNEHALVSDNSRDKSAHEPTSKCPIEQQNENVQNKEKNDIESIGTFEEDDEEVVSESDNELTIHLRKTPNLKSLRRSFLSSRSAKRQKVEANYEKVINSSKFVNDTKSSEQKSSTINTTVECFSNIPIGVINAKNSVKSIQSNSNTNANSSKFPQKFQPAENSNTEPNISQIQHNIYGGNTKPMEEDQVFVPLVNGRHIEKVLRSDKSIKTNAKCQSNDKPVKTDGRKTKLSLSSQYSKSDSIDGKNKTTSITNDCTKPKSGALKNVCVRLQRIRTTKVNDSNSESLEVHEEKRSINESNTIIGQDYHNTNDKLYCDEHDNVEKRDISEKITHSDKSVIGNNTENLLKSLLKFHSAIGNSKSAATLSSIGEKSVVPSFECASSQTSCSDIFQESPLTPLSSDIEIIESPQTEVSNSAVYDKSVTLHSPPVFTQHSSENIIPRNMCCSNLLDGSKEPLDIVCVSSSNSASDNPKQIPSSGGSSVIITPLDLPPTREEVLSGCIKLKLPDYEFQQPYYSNPDDITKQKELGFTILQINGNKLNDLEEFQSLFGADLKGLSAWRRSHLLRLGGPEMLNKYRNTQRIREYFAGPKSVVISPLMHAPTRLEAKVWLKARELLNSKGEHLDNNDDAMKILTEEDSPIKIRRQKVTMMLNIDGGESGEDGDNSLDCSTRSMTLTPMTPATPLAIDRLKGNVDKSLTPVTTKFDRIPLERVHTLRKRNNRRVLRRVSLNKKMQEALETYKSSTDSSYNSKQLEILPASDECIIPNSQKSESSSISSHTALAEMERVHSVRKRNNRRVLRRVSLNKKMQEALEKYQSSTNSSYNSKQLEILPASDECIIPNSQKSESSSVSSQTALAEMERSSFMHQMQQHDVAMGCSNNNSTLNNTLGFKVALENLQQAKADIEVFVATRDDLYPNPQIDEIRCLFYAIENSIPNDHTDMDKKLPRTSCGYIMVHDSRDLLAKEGNIHGIDQDIAVAIVQTEVEALETLLGLCSRWDPDIYAGYEIEMSSWGFVIDRAKYLCLNIAPLLSRVPSQKTRDFIDEDREQFTDLDVEMKLCGRILLDVWRLMRSEIALTSYSFENVIYHIMHKRCPWHSYRTLTEWFSAPSSRWIVIEYYLERVRGTLGLLDQLDLIGRTSEMAKLIGIQFYEVLSRGSQFRVESMMLRIAKPKNLVPLSPSVQQRAHMRAPEYLPLILEPQSRFYADPLIVLDFQSLYPSMIIGYNYCFSTCLGRVEHLGQSSPFEFGASQLRVSPSMLRKLIERDLITISPCGVVFVKSSVREGILPRMLSEILDTRQMVKQSMKIHKTNSALQRILHSRQLGLKLMANTTYGYTAANFSGRMPAVEVGDSVVAKGRETLERAIKMVEANEKWNVKVVYGDTDSLFVLVPGRNREQAFRIGEEIAEAVTKQNPQPVKLKLEKVYQPCILQTKKRYVGYMYETPDQKEPVYEAKGIETVRRDGCPIVAKMLEKVLRILFESADVSHVKQYVCRQFTKLLSGRANLQDLIFAKEFRGINGYKASACVPALELTRKWLLTDPRRIPRRGERVPFIITNGPPGVPLIRLIRHPHEVLGDEGLKINAIYYITKAIIPPLNRCLLLLGADVHEWFANLPRKILMTPALSIANEIIACPNAKSKKSTISQFFSTTNCITDCGRHTKQGICIECNQNPLRSMIILQTKISRIERAYLSTQQICQSCCGRLGDLECGSLDCPVLYVLEVKRRDLQQIGHFRKLLEENF